jgi:capsular polysaccharide biosynthesis protein
LHHVEIIGGSEMLFTSGGEVLYDEFSLGDVNRYGAKVNGIVIQKWDSLRYPAATNEFLLCTYHREASPSEIERGISLLMDHSVNYYHWLLECLPRAILANRQTEWSGAPFLIDAGIPDQFIESLLLVSPDRNHISIEKGLRQPVHEVYFPSMMSLTHDYYGSAPPLAKDFVIAPEAVALLRSNLLEDSQPESGERKHQFIYVARSGGKHRALTNEDEVITVAQKMGFSIIYPGFMSFSEQIALFENAKIILGPTGAGMVNIVFASPECKIVVMAAATRNANFLLFAQLAQYVGQKIVYVSGKPEDVSEAHSNYSVDVAVVKVLIADFMRVQADL